MLLLQAARRARSLALASAGNSNAARRAIMAITTSSSIRVNADLQRFQSGDLRHDASGKTGPGRFGSETAAPSSRDPGAGRAGMRERQSVLAREHDNLLFMKQRYNPTRHRNDSIKAPLCEACV